MGVSYLDTRNNVAHVGHTNPYVVGRIQQQVGTLNTNTRYLHPAVTKLAQKLIEKWFTPPSPKSTDADTPSAPYSQQQPQLEVVVFVNSGSEANDLALRLAKAYTGSSNTIVVDRACKLLCLSGV